MQEIQGTKREFLDAARRLFREKGYEWTTINDIIAAVDVSKGAFYHYFESKEDLLRTLAIDVAQPMIDVVREAAADTRLGGAVEKLNRIMSSAGLIRASRKPLPPAGGGRVAEAQGVELEVEESMVRVVTADLTAIVEQGIREGALHTPYPREAAEAFVRLIGMYRRRKQTSGVFLQDLLERLLGAPEGSLKVPSVVTGR